MEEYQAPQAPLDDGFKVEPLPHRDDFTIPKSGIGRFWQWTQKYGLWIIIGIIVLLGILILLFGRRGFSESRVSLQINAPEEITAGQTIIYEVIYTNDNKVGLSDAVITLNYPEGSMGERDGQIISLTKESVTIDRIPPEFEGSIEFEAVVAGDRGNVKDATASIRFRPDNVQAEFEVTGDLGTTITNLAVPITIVAPSSVIDNQTFSYIIDYQNDSDDELFDLQLVITYPEGFSPSESDPEPDQDVTQVHNEAVWDIPVLRPGDGERITVEGLVRGRQREAKDILVELRRRVTTGSGDQYVTFQQARASSVVEAPPLSVTIEANNSTDYVSQLSDTIEYQLEYANNSDVTIKDVIVRATLEGRMFDTSTVNTNGFFNSRDNSVVFNSASDPNLAVLRANSSGMVTFSVRLRDNFVGSGLDAQDSVVKVTALIETEDVPVEFGVSRLVSDNELTTRIATIPTFVQEVRYNDPIWGSAGPLPPVVDQTTTYTVTWKLSNAINSVAPARVIASLEPGVVWDGQVRATPGQPTPTFDERHNQVVWELEELPAGLGSAFGPYEGTFRIRIRPSVNQVGDAAELMRLIEFTGTDSFTGKEFTRKAPDVETNDLIDVANPFSFGRVQPAPTTTPTVVPTP